MTNGLMKLVLLSLQIFSGIADLQGLCRVGVLNMSNIVVSS